MISKLEAIAIATGMLMLGTTSVLMYENCALKKELEVSKLDAFAYSSIARAIASEAYPEATAEQVYNYVKRYRENTTVRRIEVELD